MEKRFFIYLLVFIIAMILTAFAHLNLLSFSEAFQEFLIGSYTYLICATLVVCLLLGFLQKRKEFQQQVGYFYLFSVPLKIFLFIGIFQKQFFDQTSDSNQELINCLFVMGLTLFFEVFFMSKLLNSSNATKNVE